MKMNILYMFFFKLTTVKWKQNIVSPIFNIFHIDVSIAHGCHFQTSARKKLISWSKNTEFRDQNSAPTFSNLIMCGSGWWFIPWLLTSKMEQKGCWFWAYFLNVWINGDIAAVKELKKFIFLYRQKLTV